METESIISMSAGSAAEIGYQEGFGSEDLKLLEVDESLLKEIMEKGVVIRGDLNDEAVLCTSDRTYSIKFVMTSNTVLVMPPGPRVKPNENGICPRILRAMALVNGHLELAEILPSVETLKSLLSMRPYNEETMNDGDNGDVDGDGDCDGLFTFEDLLERVQMSEMELREALDRLSAFPMGKFWRVADEALLRSVLDLIVLNSVQHDWSIRSLDEAQVVATLKDDGFPPRIVMHCLATFGQKKISGSEHGLSPNEHGQASSSVWELDQRLVCLHYAKQLLSSANPRWKLDDFLDAWRGRIPPGMDAPHLDMLRGEVLTEKMGSETWLRHFPVSKLPTNPPDRFAALFKERPRWEWQDLEPYVSDIRAPGKSVEALLLKFTRRTQPTADALPIFTAR